MKPILKAPRAKRLKLRFDKLLSSFAFNFNLRRYITVGQVLNEALGDKVGRCRLTVSNPVLKARLVSPLELECDEPLSNVAFTFNLRRYDKAGCNRMGRAVATQGAATVEVVMDLSNRPYLANGVEFRDDAVGDLSTEMIDHLFMSIASNGQMTARPQVRGLGCRVLGFRA
jgi:hypothetical protein